MSDVAGLGEPIGEMTGYLDTRPLVGYCNQCGAVVEDVDLPEDPDVKVARLHPCEHFSSMTLRRVGGLR